MRTFAPSFKNAEEVEFFLIVSPGLEELALRELIEKWALLCEKLPEVYWGELKSRQIMGGIEIWTTPAQGWILNRYLKIPTRILQRISVFRSRDLNKFHFLTSKVPWQKFLREGEIQVRVASKSSRLLMKKKIEQVAMEAIDAAKIRQGFRKPFLNLSQEVFVRIEDNEVTLSIDTSGELLHQRGYKPFSSEAPLRETLGAGLIQLCRGEEMPSLWPEVVVDPMCGSGTLVLECGNFWKPNRMRKFAFENFPCFAQEVVKDRSPSLVEVQMKVFASDISAEAVLLAEKNMTLAFAKSHIEFNGFCSSIKNLIDSETIPDLDKARAWILVNPPYGERVELMDSPKKKNLTEESESKQRSDRKAVLDQLSALTEAKKPNRIGIVWPRKWGKCELSKRSPNYTFAAKVDSKNGGLPIQLIFFRRKT